MAKISFFGVDGEEKSFTLHPQLTLRIGRDPGNDVVLRDPKVSRRHAEIVFERGFFVLHDLQSANGTYVNAIRVNVAPLTHGAEIKLGNSHARFADEPSVPRGPVEPEVPRGTVSEKARPAPAPAPPPRRATGTAEIAPEDLQGTYPHEKHRGRGDASAPTEDDSHNPFTDDTSLVEEEKDDSAGNGEKRELVEDRSFEGGRFEIDRAVPWGAVTTARDDSGQPRFFYRRLFNLVALVAALVAGIILFAGFIVAVFLALDHHEMLSGAAMGLTLAFALGILLLVPKRHIVIFSDEAFSTVALVVTEESFFGFPIVTFRVQAADGSTIGYLTRNALLNLVRRRWRFLDVSHRPVGFAKEDGLLRPFFRKFFGDLAGLLSTDYEIFAGGQKCGMFRRFSAPQNAHVLELGARERFSIDARLALAFAFLVDSIEKTR